MSTSSDKQRQPRRERRRKARVVAAWLPSGHLAIRIPQPKKTVQIELDRDAALLLRDELTHALLPAWTRAPS